MWGWHWLDALARDLRFAFRTMRKNPAFALVAVLTIGIGVGANTAVFSLLEAVVLRPLPYPEPERLFMLWTVEAKSQRGMNSSYPDFRDWREQNHVFQDLAAFHGGSLNLTGVPEPERVDALHVTPGLFELLRIQPVLGRSFSKTDEQHVAVINHGLWLRRFGGSPSVVDASIHLDGQAFTVVGVLPPGFHFPPQRFAGEPELFVPLTPNPDRTSWFLQVIGRLKPGVPQQQAQAEMNAIAARLGQLHPATHDRQGIQVDPLRRWVVGDVRQTALVLLGAVGFVLLIACANVANLLLSRGTARQQEIAIRMAIGASRGRVVRQLFTEALVLAVMGAILGTILALWAIPLLTAAAPERTSFFTRVRDAGIQLNLRVLWYTAAVTLLAGFLFGSFPAWRFTRPARSSVSRIRSGQLRGTLVMLEVSLTFVLLCGAGLMVKSLLRLLDVDPGFRTERLLTMYASVPDAKYPTPERRTRFFRQVLQRLEALPGVVSAGGIVDLPLTRAYSVNTFEIEGSPPQKGRAVFHAVSPGYFPTMDIPLLRGRLLTEADSDDAAGVAIVNRSMVQRYWPNDDPIGKAILASRGIREQTAEGTHLRFVKQRLEIVGIVGDVRQVALDDEPRPELFMPYPQRPSSEMTFVVRTAVEPASLVPAAKKEIWRVDPDQPVTDIKTMDEWLSLDIAPRRFVLLLIGVFALMAVVLAAIGIYGVISYAVEQRTQEIGIRMALGAQRGNVLCLVLRQSVVWLASGIAAGTAGAMGLTSLLASHLYAVRPTDPRTFLLVGFILLAVALIAHAVPARRATKIDPMEALRYE